MAATDLSSGSIPAYYRDVYEKICSPSSGNVEREVFKSLLVKSQLASPVLSQIWNLVDNKTGCVTRSVLYKALALVAMAQQGKQPSDKLLENTESQELPVPTLGDLQDVVALAQRLQRSSDPTNLNLSYSEICDLDTLEINLVPEKKGIFLKHVEYQVTSKALQRFPGAARAARGAIPLQAHPETAAQEDRRRRLAISRGASTLAAALRHADRSASRRGPGPHLPVLLHVHGRGDAAQDTRHVSPYARRVRHLGAVESRQGARAARHTDGVRQRARPDTRHLHGHLAPQEHRRRPGHEVAQLRRGHGRARHPADQSGQRGAHHDLLGHRRLHHLAGDEEGLQHHLQGVRPAVEQGRSAGGARGDDRLRAAQSAAGSAGGPQAALRATREGRQRGSSTSSLHHAHAEEATDAGRHSRHRRRHDRADGEPDGRPGVGDSQRRAEESLLAALPAHGDAAHTRPSGDSGHCAAEPRQRSDTRPRRAVGGVEIHRADHHEVFAGKNENERHFVAFVFFTCQVSILGFAMTFISSF